MSHTAVAEQTNSKSLPALSYRGWLLIAVIAGVALRLALIVASGWRIDYDEAMLSLLGTRVMRGELMAFTPAQSTLGSLDAYLLVPLYALFGANPIATRVLSLLWTGGYIVTSGLLARAAFDHRAGVIAALLAAIAPSYMLIVGMKIWGGTIETLVPGNLLLLATFYAVEKAQTPRDQRRAIALVGFIAGVMFWIAWLGFYYFVPVGLVLLWRGRTALLRGWWAGVIAFFAGSLPFWLYNLSTGFATFTEMLRAPGASPDTSAIFRHMFTDLVPRLVTADAHWGMVGPLSRLLLTIIYYAGIVALLAAPLLWRRERGLSLRWMLALFAVTVPVIYLLSGYGQPALNPWGLDATGRYVLMFHSVLPIGVALLATALGSLQRPLMRYAGVALALVTFGLNLLSVSRLDPVKAFDSPYYDRLPESLEPLVAYLDAQGIAHVWTDAGIGHVLMFITGERIITADYYDTYLTEGFLRFPDALAKVEAAERTAFVVPVMPVQVAPPIERALDAAGVEYSVTDVLPTLRVYLPDEHLDPAVIAAGLGYQY